MVCPEHCNAYSPLNHLTLMRCYQLCKLLVEYIVPTYVTVFPNLAGGFAPYWWHIYFVGVFTRLRCQLFNLLSVHQHAP